MFSGIVKALNIAKSTLKVFPEIPLLSLTAVR